MDSNEKILYSLPASHSQGPHSGRRSLPPANLGSQHVLPSYPSSTLRHYFPSPYYPVNYAHILPSSQHFSSHPSDTFAQGPLPSASQAHIPSLRESPLTNPLDNIHIPIAPHSPFERNHVSPLISQRIQSLSPIAFYQPRLPSNFPSPQPDHVFNAPHTVPVFPVPQPDPIPPIRPPHTIPPQYHRLPPAPIPPPPQISPVTSTLPSTKDVPILTGKHDWGPWHSAVRTLILNANLLGHIADAPLPGAVFDPGLWPTHPPIVHQRSSPAELQHFTDWWSRDGMASHVLTSRLSPSVLGSLPIANERMGHRRSARSVYYTLRHQYGAGDYSAVMIIEARLRQLRCLPTRGGVRVSEFIATWRVSVNQMEAAGFLPGIRHLLTIFADGLPNNTVAFINLYDSILSSLNDPNEQSLPNIHLLFDRTVNIDNNIQRNRILHPSPRRLPPNNPITSTTTLPTPATPPGAPNVVPQTNRHTHAATPLCSNCGRPGHTDRTCFQPGGGMEGRREEYLASRVPKPIAHIAEVEENQPDIEEPENTFTIEEDTLNNEFAAMSFGASNNIQFSTYALSSLSENLPEHFALNSFSPNFNTALDSACTNHIFRDREVFHTYNVEGAVPVKTANCGILTTHGIGDVKIKLLIQGKTITWTLKNCLHAPDVPINLISVGALQEHRMSIIFSFQKTTICFPSDHPLLSDHSFDAHVTRRLSLLNLDFIFPQSPPLALHLFIPIESSPETWHRRFGHLGHEASKNVLNGNYVTGITKSPTPYPVTSKCIPCLIGKSPQAPYPNNAKRAAAVGDLIHIDTCGPFPTLTPKKEAYFTIFLDDASNYGVTTLLTNKSDVFPAWKKVEASWELTSGNRIKTVRLDGAKEFTQGSLGKHLRSRGIAMQITAPYAHAQAGKAERYVRTIEDGVQTLLADAKLPPSFWGDAALTTQYLRNRLPTSTLPPDTTPYEAMHGNKPDLSHLRVWGCQCFPSIPPELRTKGGPRRYEAIFVGYEEN